jgi:bifunctional DNA-binding transcriptional regulator/antitoxin component of YhaV-PrlF toxin-antitoxin module
MKKVKNRRRSTSRISSKHQVTIPTDALRAAGLKVGERLVAHAEGPGRVVFEREADVLAEFAGVLTGVYGPDEVAGLRDEWD